MNLDWPMRTQVEIAPGDAGTLGVTLPWMRTLVAEGRADPAVRARAAEIVAQHPRLHPVEALFRYAQGLPYVYDEELLRARGYGLDASELLQGAPFQVARERTLGAAAAPGDCDDRAILLQSLLESLGYVTRFALVRGPGRADYAHVYSEVALPTGWVPLDAIMNGHGGRPVFDPGSEVGLAEGARDKVTVPVDAPAGGLGWWPLALLALSALGRGGHG